VNEIQHVPLQINVENLTDDILRQLLASPPPSGGDDDSWRGDDNFWRIIACEAWLRGLLMVKPDDTAPGRRETAAGQEG
jgi:hypothetical protein